MTRHKGPGSDVHLTPPEVWDRVQAVEPGATWFDPCPHPWTVCGLSNVWGDGPTYVNPPFSDLLRWAARAHEAGARGETVVVLVPVRTSQPYWSRLAMSASDIAFWTGDKDHGGKIPRRVRFLRPDGTRQAGAPFDTALFLLSNDLVHRERFERAFGDVATVVRLRPHRARAGI
jgi:hypothetical protein